MAQQSDKLSPAPATLPDMTVGVRSARHSTEGGNPMTEATELEIEHAILAALNDGHQSAKRLLKHVGTSMAQQGKQADRYRLRQGLYRLMSDGKIRLDPGFVPCSTQPAST